MPKKILVTGACGFIGTALVSCLAQKRGVTVLGIDRISRTSKDLRYYQVDLLNQEKVKAILTDQRPNIIIHLAGGRSGEASQVIASNISTSINLFEAIRSLKNYHPRFMIAGSAAEYGKVQGARRPILEKQPAQPLGLYGWVKLLQTKIGLYYAGLGVDIIIARFFNILGPGTGEDMAAGRFAHDIVALEKSSQPKVMNVSNLGAVRDFLDIRDICEALVILSSKGKKGEIYNVCSGKGTTMRELLNAMIAASKQRRIKVIENKKNDPGVIYAVGSNAKLRRTTGWKAGYDMSGSIRDTLAFYRRKLG